MRAVVGPANSREAERTAETINAAGSGLIAREECRAFRIKQMCARMSAGASLQPFTHLHVHIYNSRQANALFSLNLLTLAYCMLRLFTP